MWFHDELVPTVRTYGLTPHFTRVDGLRAVVGGGHKAEWLAKHLAELGLGGHEVVLIGDSLDDADAAGSVGAPASSTPVASPTRPASAPAATPSPTPSPTRSPWPAPSPDPSPLLIKKLVSGIRVGQTQTS